MREYHKGEMYTNGNNKYVIDGFWYNKGEIVRVELKNISSGKIYEYQANEFDTALRDGLITIIFK
jgi:hypothetical protein